MSNNKNNSSKLPIYSSKLSTKKNPSVQDFLEGHLDLNEHLLKNSSSIFFLRVTGDLLVDIGIYPDDILVVDSSIELQSEKIIVVILDGRLAVRRYFSKKGKFYLCSENTAYLPLEIDDKDSLHICGIVTNIIHGI